MSSDRKSEILSLLTNAPSNTEREIRTHNNLFLRQVPLPVGIFRHILEPIAMDCPSLNMTSDRVVVGFTAYSYALRYQGYHKRIELLFTDSQSVVITIRPMTP